MKEVWDIVTADGRRTGKTHLRGVPMQPGDYHPSVSVWLTDGEGRFLISRRCARKGVAPGLWETVGGSVLAGESCLDAALREVREELGIALNGAEGRLFTAYPWPHSSGDGWAYIEVWLFPVDPSVPALLQPEEVSAVLWAAEETIRTLIRKEEFIPYTYLEELFAFSSRRGMTKGLPSFPEIPINERK